MKNELKPASQEELCDAISAAASNQQKLNVHGSKSKALVGNLMDTTTGLDLCGFTGINLYEPEELVISCGAGTTLEEIKHLLKKNNQIFAFEPPDFSQLLQSNSAGTLGGMVASGFAGSRRISAGSVRDYVLGVKAVSGRGEAFKTGGRVMKNVTGYDLPKVMTGSWGTLACMTEVTFKVLPRPETEATISIAQLDNETAISAMRDALSAPVDVSGAAHIPGARTLLRLEGIEPSVNVRREHLKKVLGPYGDIDVLSRETSQNIWQKVNDAKLLGTDPKNAVWRISVPPSVGAKVLAQIEDKLDVMAFFDWGGGLLWIEVLNQPTACAAQIRGAIAKTGGHATLIRATEKSRAGSAVFQPQQPVLAALSDRVKAAFDPSCVLNPGRMYERNK